MKYNRGAGELEALLAFIAAFIAGLIMLSGTHRDSADNQRPVYLTVTLSFEAGESTNLVAGQQVKVVTLKDPLVITVDEYNKIKQMQSEAQ